MHRLQVCIEQRQYERLRQKARQLGVSIAEVVRRALDGDGGNEREVRDEAYEALLALAGTFVDTKPLIDGLPVSENVDLYLAHYELESGRHPPTRVLADTRDSS